LSTSGCCHCIVIFSPHIFYIFSPLFPFLPLTEAFQQIGGTSTMWDCQARLPSAKKACHNLFSQPYISGKWLRAPLCYIQPPVFTNKVPWRSPRATSTSTVGFVDEKCEKEGKIEACVCVCVCWKKCENSCHADVSIIGLNLAANCIGSVGYQPF